jgi:hypothetical protein
VGRFGTVKSVSVRAWPAVELLWGQADSVKVRAASLDMNTEQSMQRFKVFTRPICLSPVAPGWNGSPWAFA